MIAQFVHAPILPLAEELTTCLMEGTTLSRLSSEPGDDKDLEVLEAAPEHLDASPLTCTRPLRGAPPVQFCGSQNWRTGDRAYAGARGQPEHGAERRAASRVALTPVRQ